MHYKASVKVMRSYDYCHFEVNLGTDLDLSVVEVDDMRKVAATLVDEAVEDYKRMKAQETKRNSAGWDREQMKRRLQAIKEKPEGERTINEVAQLKASEDREFWDQFKDADGYDYFTEDDERSFHFARLAKKERVKV